MPKIALVLHGGGFVGAKQIGLPKELWQRGKPPNIIQGVSVGAINAAKLVESGPEELEKSWLEKEKHKKGGAAIFNWRGVVWHAFSNSALGDEGLNGLVNELNLGKIINSPIELQIAVRNETQEQLEFFSNRSPEVLKNPEILRLAIKASACLTGFFPPAKIGDNWHSDGYYFDLERLADCETIFVVLNDDPKYVPNPFDHFSERFSVGPSWVLDDLIELKIESFLEHHPNFEFVLDSPKKFLQRSLNLYQMLRQKIAQAMLGSGLLVVQSPRYSIPTLRFSKFNPGDITKAARDSTNQAKELLDQLKF